MLRISSRLSKPRRADKAKTGPYGTTGYERFLDHEGYSAMKPPWGQLNAINLNTGEFAWRVPLGEHVELTARGIPRTGTETFGGSIVTAGGLVFIAGTKDERIHAFDKETGRASLGTSPAGRRLRDSRDLSVNGRQYVVIAAGGAGKLQTKAGDAFVAFSLDSELKDSRPRIIGRPRNLVEITRRISAMCRIAFAASMFAGLVRDDPGIRGGAAGRRTLAGQGAGRRRHQGPGDQPDSSVAARGTDQADHQCHANRRSRSTSLPGKRTRARR